MTRERLGFRMTLTAALVAGIAFGQSAEDLRLTIGKSIVIDYPSDIRQISTSNPDVVDASPVTTREVLLHAKALGSATMVVWSKTDQRTFYNVSVELNLDPLRRILRESFPNEKISLESSRDSISLNGRVSSKEVADRAVALAAAASKTVVNNLQLGSAPIEKQILLRVKFAELDRQKDMQYGINMIGAPGNNLAGITAGTPGFPTFSGTLTAPPGVGTTSVSAGSSSGAVSGLGSNANSNSTSTSTAASLGTFTISQVLSLFAFDPHLNLGAFIKALESESILQILAEPNLVTTNGKEAYFLVGGEFPVPILQGGANSGAVTIQFREFGIRLTFLPQITENKTIKMYLKQEVSTLDTSNAVTFNGFTIPALATRRAETNVELGEGQSFVVAGLVDNQERDSLSKIPVLSSLPIFGSLFKYKTENKQRTELIVIVTPEVTEPLGPNDARPSIYMPKDFLVRLDPKDVPGAAQAKASSSKKK
jgi:pilus assembly protein CpaC